MTFIANATGLPDGGCIATIQNQGLGSGPRTVQLPEGQQGVVLADTRFKITLSRGNGRISLTIEMLDGRLNGDWQIALTMSGATGGAAMENRS